MEIQMSVVAELSNAASLAGSDSGAWSSLHGTNCGGFRSNQTRAFHSLAKLMFVFALALVSSVLNAGSITYIYTDPQGTPLAESSSTGALTATFDYRPYGSAYAGSGLAPPSDGPGYTGHVNDVDTALMYMQARYYDPAIGRFLSMDPIGIKDADVFDFNRFAYTNNNPINKVDPDGRQVAPGDDGPVAIAARAGIGIDPGAAHEAGKMGLSAVPVVGDAINVNEAIQSPTAFNVTMAVVGAVPVVGTAIAAGMREVSAGVRAIQIAKTMSARTQRAVTIAVTETKEGVRVVSSSEGALRPAARAALQSGEVAAGGVKGTHAEINGINAAKEMGLTPTGTAASRPICPTCANAIKEQGVEPLSPLK